MKKNKIEYLLKKLASSVSNTKNNSGEKNSPHDDPQEPTLQIIEEPETPLVEKKHPSEFKSRQPEVSDILNVDHAINEADDPEFEWGDQEQKKILPDCLARFKRVGHFSFNCNFHHSLHQRQKKNRSD